MFKLVYSLFKSSLGQFMASIGLSIITYKGVDLAFGVLSSQLTASYSSLGSDVIGLLGLAGFDQGISIILGAMAFKVGMSSFKKIGFKK